MSPRYRVYDHKGDVLCTYKDTPDSRMQTTGFIGANALELLTHDKTLRPLEFHTRAGAMRALGMYAAPSKSNAGGSVHLACASLNGGW